MQLLFAALILIVSGESSSAAPKKHVKGLPSPKPSTFPEPMLEIINISVGSGISVRGFIIEPDFGPRLTRIPSSQEVPQLRRQAGNAKGNARIELLMFIALALQNSNEDFMEGAAEAFRDVIAEPDFDSYPKADEVLYQAAVAFAFAGVPDDLIVLRKLLLQYPKSALISAAHYKYGVALATSPTIRRAGTPDEKRQRDDVLNSSVEHLEFAISHGTLALSTHARFKLVQTLQLQGNHTRALAELLRAASADRVDPMMLPMYSAASVESFAQAKPADEARSFFDLIDAPSSVQNLGDLGVRYVSMKNFQSARDILTDVVKRETDLDRLCKLHGTLLEAVRHVGSDREIKDEAVQFSKAARRIGGQCQRDAQDAFHALAWQSYRAKPTTTTAKLDSLQWWELAVANAEDEVSKKILAKNRAYAAWHYARTGRSLALWAAAHAAMAEAAEVTKDAVFVAGAQEAERRQARGK
jgi:hypothetical protein